MIDYVDLRLQQWGRWCMARLDGDLGSTVHGFGYCEPDYGPGRYCSTPLIREDCVLTHAAVTWLAICGKRALQEAIVMHYRDGIKDTAEACAARLAVCRRTYFYRIERAHLDIMGFLTQYQCRVITPPILGQNYPPIPNGLTLHACTVASSCVHTGANGVLV